MHLEKAISGDSPAAQEITFDQGIYSRWTEECLTAAILLRFSLLKTNLFQNMPTEIKKPAFKNKRSVKHVEKSNKTRRGATNCRIRKPGGLSTFLTMGLRTQAPTFTSSIVLAS